MKIACVQMTSRLEPQKNIEKLEVFFAEARAEKCQAIFLPEVYLSKGDGQHRTPYQVTFSNEYFHSLQRIVKKYQLYTLGGSVIFDEGGVSRNRVINFSPNGEVINYYDKMYMFSCHLEDREPPLIIDEENFCVPGTRPVLVDIAPFKIGISVCFDVRYPELYWHYRKQGANMLSISSAFTVPTGKAHWHTLVCARAIENQSYVVASCQWGVHNEKITSYGHSLIVDPWGRILADAKEGEKILLATLDVEEVKQSRAKVNVGRYL